MTSNSARLYYLVQYTSGEVRELMRSCLAMKPEDGYQEARTLLKDRYGQSYRIPRMLKGSPIYRPSKPKIASHYVDSQFF